MLSHIRKRRVEIGVERDSRLAQHGLCRWKTVPDETRNDRYFQCGRLTNRGDQKLRKLTEFGDARENIDEHHADARCFAYPLKHFDEPRGFAAQPAGADIEKIVWP